MRKFMLPLALFAFVAVLFSCKKDPEPTKTELITGKNWRITAGTIEPGLTVVIPGSGSMTTTDFTLTLSDCQKDNFWTFYTDLKLILDESTTKCNSSGPQTFSGAWSWLAGETQLKTEMNGTNTTYTVIQLDATTFKGSYSKNYGATTHVITETWTKQ